MFSRRDTTTEGGASIWISGSAQPGTSTRVFENFFAHPPLCFQSDPAVQPPDGLFRPDPPHSPRRMPADQRLLVLHGPASTGTASTAPQLPSATATFRSSPRRLARWSGPFLVVELSSRSGAKNEPVRRSSAGRRPNESCRMERAFTARQVQACGAVSDPRAREAS
jgi:hypothetical protein